MSDILFLDIGTKCGWARSTEDAERPSTHGMINLAPGRFASAGTRFTKFREFLARSHGDTPLGRIVFEEVRRHRGTDAAHIYGGLLATLQTFCLDHGIEYEGLPVGTIKKHVTGKGNAGKPEMVSAVQKGGYPSVRDDNEADAIGTGLTWLSLQGTIVRLATERSPIRTEIAETSVRAADTGLGVIKLQSGPNGISVTALNDLDSLLD